MAFSKIVLTFTNWDSGDWTGTTCGFQVDGNPKNETAKLIRVSPGDFEGESLDQFAALNYMNAWVADYAGTQFTASRIGNVVTITATYDGAVFSDFSSSPGGRIAAVITNVPFDPLLEIEEDSVEEAATNKCTTVKVVLTAANGTPPYVWNTILPGNIGLEGNVPRSGGPIDIEIEDDNAEIDTVTVNVPALLDNTAINSINIVGDPSGLFGSVTIGMAALFMLTYTYSLDDVSYQSSNIFTGVLPGTYTIYIKDQYGCKISQEFTVTLATIRPPVYRLIPNSNSFGWFEQQAAVNQCTNPYNGRNARPNDYKPRRWYNPKYFQPWCSNDNPQTQFRSNYDTLVAQLYKLPENTPEGSPYTLEQISNNIGQRQVMDAKIYDRGSGQTGIYFESGNTYEPGGVVVNGSYSLMGQLPEWAKVGQTFSLSGSAADGIYEIVQIIYDSTLLVNAIVIDRVYTDISEPTVVIVDAAYNRLNYETYQFTADFNSLTEGCYKILLTMSDTLEEYPTAIYETHPFVVRDGDEDDVILESATHVDDGIVYGSIIHKQRFSGVFYAEDYPSTYETSRDSRKALNKQDGRVEKVMMLDVIDVPDWVHEKLALFISKEYIAVNGLEVQIEEPFEVERPNPTYARVNLRAECTVKDYEQYVTNAYDIL